MFMGTTMFLPRVIVFHQDHAAFMVTKLVGYKTISLVFFYTGVPSVQIVESGAE